MATVTHGGTLPNSADKADFYAIIDNATVINITNADISNSANIGNSKLNLSSISQTVSMNSRPINEAQGGDIASATTTDIGAATGNFVKVTGTTTITGLGTVQAGTRRIVQFTGILTLTHNGTSLILPGSANITTTAGDTATFVSLGSGNWKCVQYQRVDGTSVVGVNAINVPRSLFRNLAVSRSSNTAVALTADELILQDSSNFSARAVSVSLSIDITNSGANGLDAPSEAANTIYYIWVIRKSSDGTVAGLLSTSATSPTMPSGYDQKGLFSAVGNNNSSNFIPFHQTGRRYTFDTWATLATGSNPSGGSTFDSLDLTPSNLSTFPGFVPSALSNFCYGVIRCIGGANRQIQISNVNSISASVTDSVSNKFYIDGTSSGDSQTAWQLDVLTADTLYWIGQEQGGTTGTAIWLQGFELNKLT